MHAGAQAMGGMVRFSVPAGFGVPDLGRAGIDAVPLPREEWRAVHFDTADHRLRERGIRLCHCEDASGGSGSWTLEIPTLGGGIPEVSVLTWTGSRAAMPAGAVALVSGTVRRAPMRRGAELRVLRQRHVLRGASAVPVGELRDDAVTVEHPTGDLTSFRELAVEMHCSGGGIAGAVLGALSDAGAPRASPSLEAQILDPGGGPSATRRRVPSRSARIGDVVRFALAEGLDHILDRDLRLRMDPRAPAAGDVHQARVAARRLRSELSTFRALLDPVWLRHVRDDLRWLGAVLGEVRDTDIFLDIVTDPDGPHQVSRNAIRQQLVTQRVDASRALAAALESRRYLDLLDRLRAAAACPPFYGEIPPTRRARRVLPGLVATRWRVLRTAVRSAGTRPSDQALHRIRIEAKALRYSAEVAVPVMGKRAVRTARDARDLQTVLGAHHDAVAAETWLRDRHAADDASGVFAAGWLAAAQHDRQEALRRRWPSSWKPLAHRQRHRWVR